MPPITQEQFDRLSALKCAVAYNEYGAYCVPLSSRHRPAAQTILRGDVYEPQTIAFMRENCDGGDIVHAGTYFGDFLPSLSQACQGTVWAFEPNSENFHCAEITRLLNNLKNVELVRAGLGARRESCFLLTADSDGLPRGGSSKIVVGGAEMPGRTEMVQVVTVDEVIPSDRKVSILQLDVEGHEQDALAGALRTINRSLPIVIVEILADSPLLSTNWLAEKLGPLGYRAAGMVHGNSIFLPAK